MLDGLILGCTRLDDDPHGRLTGLVVRRGGALKAEPPEKVAIAHRLAWLDGRFQSRPLARFEETPKGGWRALFTLPDGRLAHDGLTDQLQFSEGKKALLKPQILPGGAGLHAPVAAYLEVARLADTAADSMLGGERTLGDLAAVLGLKPGDAALEAAVWDLSKAGVLDYLATGPVAAHALSLRSSLEPSAGPKRR